MITKTPYPHQTFLQVNNIPIGDLPELLQKRIHGFEELEEDFEHLVGDDRDTMEDKLKIISHEIDEDLEEHFHEHLENNDHEEPEIKSEKVIATPSPAISPVVKEEEPAPVEKIKETDPAKAKENVLEAKSHETHIGSERRTFNSPPITDEGILQSFLKENKNKVSYEELKAKGFNGDLEQKEIPVGKYHLRIEKYETAFTIYLK